MNVERVKTLYTMMIGIPTKKVKLQMWRIKSTKEEPLPSLRVSDNDLLQSCGTMACILGWASVYPPFKDMDANDGMKLWYDIKEADVMCSYPDPVYGGIETAENFDAGAKFFGLENIEAHWMFTGVRQDGEYDMPSDKAVALSRIRCLLLKHKVITEERNEELAQLEQSVI